MARRVNRTDERAIPAQRERERARDAVIRRDSEEQETRRDVHLVHHAVADDAVRRICIGVLTPPGGGYAVSVSVSVQSPSVRTEAVGEATRFVLR